MLLCQTHCVEVIALRRGEPELLVLHQPLEAESIDGREDIPSVLVIGIRDPWRRIKAL
jgi:hypothetical protein